MSPAAAAPAPLSLLRLPDVLKRTGMGRTMLYNLVKRGTFPASIKLSRRCVAWPSDAVERWVRARIDEARGEGGAA